ncbi:MAG: tRNA (adenosine(37)-N6)-threonylcarbamoyltransferase complex dimerization subunit type 1 TsaB [Candidatus Levybacteria bacterium]|nr:tRNA (adenosine(37)-N6)-threonylcarbamoyltransferase complex dimerization subunit type 1 TsaB [Candidatus Levybacteria bacterium]
MKIILHIDTSNNKEIVIGLEIDGKKDERRQVPNHRRGQIVIPMIQSLLADHALQLKDLTAINVHAGPGSFTGLRVGITIANTLGQLLQIPVNGKKVGEPVDAVYA